ncbi:hypothetical protein [Halodesulfovibrio spirochaetisodalis]|uniref:hypothetical protein n=1 Tax=Halodesulfovibrio spirochaetisodalis TaxID=1560234 RepID=UPI00082A0DE2|nr:hypothetical protein [Halodesulfovibrio spirochaetisodalis]
MDMQNIFFILDPVFIAPYRWLLNPVAAMWTGSAVLALWCLLAGEISSIFIYRVNRAYYAKLNEKMVRMHNLSIEAIKQKDKANFKATNRWANEYFGKVFFAQAAFFAVSLWPVPFALGWMQTRFTGIDIVSFPVPSLDFGKLSLTNFSTEFISSTTLSLGYAFVLLTSYIILRYTLYKTRKYIPVLRNIEAMREEDSELIHQIKSWEELNTSPHDPAPQTKEKTVAAG